MKKHDLTIVIPRYNETPAVIHHLLSSIDNQIGVDCKRVRSMVVDDNPEHPYTPMHFEEVVYRDENGGPGVARQRGIDVVDTDYVMFCDADDVFHSVGVLGAIFEELDDSHPDILDTDFLEETLTEEGKYVYVKHEPNLTWLHGKVFRTEFLRENDIEFHPDFRVHEDSYFLHLCTLYEPKRVYLPIISYVWMYHENSITRKNDAEYDFNSLSTYVDIMHEAHKVTLRERPEKIYQNVAQLVIYLYFQMHRFRMLEPKFTPWVNEVENAIHSYFVDFLQYFDEISMESKFEVYNTERSRLTDPIIESETLWEWIGRLIL